MSETCPKQCPKCGSKQQYHGTCRVNEDGSEVKSTTWHCGAREIVEATGEVDWKDGAVCKGLAFKAYTHERMDNLGAPHTVEGSEHTKAGCRIGGRFDWVEQEIASLRASLADSQRQVEFYRNACSQANDEVCQIAGKALGYMWYKDDQETFPGATEENGVFVGDHVAATIVEELLRKYADEQRMREEAEAANHEVLNSLEWTGDGYEWNPQHGHYVEKPWDAINRGSREHLKKLAALTARAEAAEKRAEELDYEVKCLRESESNYCKAVGDLCEENAAATSEVERLKKLKTIIQQYINARLNSPATAVDRWRDLCIYLSELDEGANL